MKSFITIIIKSFVAYTLIFLAGNIKVLEANNLNIANVTTSGTNIIFDISWENSWYASVAPNNWDAVWVFVKYKTCGTDTWSHATLSSNPANHSVAGGVLQLDTVADSTGIFVRRSATGTGNIPITACTIKLTLANGNYDFKVFGIEMVKILNEDFDIGDENQYSKTFNNLTITAEDSIPKANLGSDGIATLGLPAPYPKGWDAFYCMKYEISQEQYVAFLNTLTYTQQNTRTATAPSSARLSFAMTTVAPRNRNYIQIDTSGVASTTPAVYACNLDNDAIMNEGNDGQSIACNYLSWADLTAYLDWAALRPMSDLEFEKIGRGPIGRVPGEYSWGNSTIVQARSNNISNSGQSKEVSNTVAASLCAYGYSSGGPLRVGYSATNASSRVQSGATYYGVLNMGGNVWERNVASNDAGRSFTGTTGDGTLDASGNATNTDWPGTDAVGSGRRGIGFGVNVAYGGLSNRFWAYSTQAARNKNDGGRGVR